MKSASLVIAIALLALGLGSCQQKKGDSTAAAATIDAQCPMHPTVRGGTKDRCTICGMNLVGGTMCGLVSTPKSSDLVLLSPDSVRITGVRTSEVKKKPLLRTLRISGMIGEDESRHGVISAPVEGRIDGLSMNHEGQNVTQRQPIATIFSRTLLAAAKDYKLALTQGGETLEKAKRTLQQHGLVWEQIKTIPERQPDDLYFGILSPRTGTIVKSFIDEGQYVKRGQKLFETADFTTMWFHCMVPEQDVAWLKQGQIVKLHTATMPGVTLTSRVYSISPNLDGMQRSAKVRVVLENPDRKLKNQAFAEGVVEIETTETLTVPRSAVLWSGEMPRVYVEKEVGHYEPRMLKLGLAGDEDWEVFEGLKPGERVVTSGNMLVDGQTRLNIVAHD